MNLGKEFAVCRSLPRAERTSGRARWLHDAIVALAVSSIAAMLCVASEAHAQKLIQISGATRTISVLVAVGKSQDLRTDAIFSDVTVGDPEVADVNPLTDRTLSILGKKIGTTRVSVYGNGKKLVGIFDIEVTYDVTRLTNELRRRFPGSRIEASSVNGRIMLSGRATDAAMLDQAVTIARQFGPEIINTVAVTAPQQVMLEVRFVEVSRTASRELGFQWNRFGEQSIANIGNRLPAGRLPTNGISSAGVISGQSPFGFAIAHILGNGWTLDAALNALETKGVARSLAEPNLVALSGDTASFLAGGEYPIPVSGSLGQITVDYKKYGVGLAFTPTVLGQGMINLKIEPEVSQIDVDHTVTVTNGISVPALIVRRASTTVELRDGQSFAIGGLLQTNTHHQVEQLPWVGSVPVLGTLFSSKAYQNNETDLVILVTPHLVRPTRPGDVVKTPAETSLPANDVDFFLMGKTELTHPEARDAPMPETQLAGAAAIPMSGHMLDMGRGDSSAAIQ